MKKLLLYLLFALASVYWVQVRFERAEEFYGSREDRLIAGTAHLPHQYRDLVPAVVRLLVAHTPLTAHKGFRLVEGLFFFATLCAFRPFLVSVCGARPDAPPAIALSLLYPLAFTFALPPWLPREPFDTPAVFFLMVLLLLAQRRQWALFYPLFIAATVNRETSLLAIVYCAADLWRAGLPRGRLLAHLAAQGALWVGVKAWLWWLYGHNLNYGNSLFAAMFLRNLGILAHPANWPRLASVFGYALVLLALRPRDAWRALAPPLWAVAGFYALVVLGVGLLTEIRVMGDVLPLAWAAVLRVYFERPAAPAAA